MLLARVVGSVVATVKDPALESRTLLVIQPVAPSGAPAGASLVAIDGVGVGPGEDVLFVKGREAAFAFLPDTVLADASIVGKVDKVDVGHEGERAEEAGRQRARRSTQLGAVGVGPHRTNRSRARALNK
jgi:microcompartment protein CcmK/EutM